MALKADDRSIVLLFSLVLSLAAMGGLWHFGVGRVVPAPDHFGFPTLLKRLWYNAGHQELATYSSQVGRFFLAVGYPYYFLADVTAGIVVFGGVASLIEGASTRLIGGCVGGVIGGGLGTIAMFVAPWFAPGVVNPLLLALAMPGLAWIFGSFGVALSEPDDSAPVVRRGTRIREKPVNARGTDEKAIAKQRTALVGVMLAQRAEVRHLAAIGVTGSGKSVALRGLMYTALRRGDRHVIADPDGSSMRIFYRAGDVILNPFDARSARWDILSEIREDTDYRFLAESVLPFSKGADDNEWIKYAREIFTACLRSWHESRLGPSDAFFQAVATADREKLAMLCEGTAAARYFERGNEKMLGSVLGTMGPALESMRQLSRVRGAPFSVRRWIRQGRGSLWLPYQSQQIPALRGLISCWLGLAIGETLSLTDSEDRRIWFHIDELDALGRIQNLKDAQTRVRKKGGCVVMGFQSIAQVRAVYGEPEAHTLIENCDNKLILRCGASENGGTAKFASELIGEREVEREETTTSRSSGSQGTTSTSTARRRQIEKAVLPSEITRLTDCNGYLKVASEPDWRRVSFEPVQFHEQVDAYVPAERMAPDIP